MLLMEISLAILIRFIVSLILSSILAISGYKKKSLSFDGAVAAIIVGTSTGVGGYINAAILISFYLSSSKLTKLGKEKKKKIEQDYELGAQRTWHQVVVNSIWGTIFCLLHLVGFGSDHPYLNSPSIDHNQAFLIAAFLGHYACCNGDTWSSELGVLSPKPPVLIITGKQVPAGTNGGISMFGCGAAFFGGLWIGLTYLFFLPFFGTPFPSPTSSPSLPYFVLVLTSLSGLLGSLIDSILGATLQYSGVNKEGLVVNSPAPNVKHISGINLLSNHQVNLVSALIMSVLCGFSVELFL